MTIGIANLPNQKHRKAAKKGAVFNLMVVGPSGVGKTTFVNTLFTTTLANHKNKIPSELEVRVATGELEERGFKLKVNVIQTDGFGDFPDNSKKWNPIVKYIEKHYQNYMEAEMQPDRSSIVDERVHACLYFIEPTGHQLKPLDIEAMKVLGKIVNLIPVIGKADTILPDEMKAFKERIREQLKAFKIQTYSCPIESDDESTTQRNRDIMSALPFAIIGSEETHTVKGQKVIGREYPWGIAEVENDDHCDFKKLRSLLLRTHLLDIILNTNTFYENYRDAHMVQGKEEVNIDDARKDFLAKKKKEEAKAKEEFKKKVDAEEEKVRKRENELKEFESTNKEKLSQLQSKLKTLKQEVEQMEAAPPSKKKK